MDFFDSIFHFFYSNFPSYKYIYIGLPLAIGYGWLSLYISGYLKMHKGWKTGYTRKLFHFITFLTAMVVQLLFEISGVFVFGAGVSLVILFALFRNKGNILYEAMAREKDWPHETLFIIQPFLATLFGGLIINYFFAQEYVGCAYLIAGCGDAMGEPIGVRFGKHKYRVPTLAGIKSYRSIEGSIAVFLTCLLVVAIYFFLISLSILPWQIFAIAAFCALVEAISPHGWDNFVILVGSAWIIGFVV